MVEDLSLVARVVGVGDFRGVPVGIGVLRFFQVYLRL